MGNMSGGMGEGASGKTKANAVVGAIVAVVVIAAFVAIAAMRFGVFSSGDAGELRSLVHDADGVSHEISLSADSETTITTSLGTNVVAVRDGAVCVIEADCDNHDCIRQGSIDAPGQQIICLPHRLWIEVVADGGSAGQMDVDAAAGEAHGEGGFDVVAR